MVRLDANRYESILPVAADSSVTATDGHEVKPEDGRFFLLKEKPDVDAGADGYRPSVVTFDADGTLVADA